MRFKRAEHCDGFGCILSWMAWVFCCLHLHGISKYVVVKGRCWKRREKKELFQGSVVVVFFCAWLVFWVGFFFNEESCIFK